MGSISAVNSALSYVPVTTSPAFAAAQTTSNSPSLQDEVELSLAGRIALGVNDGRLTSAQGQSLDSQLSSITQQIQSGASNVGQLENQLSEQIYGDGHNGASIPSNIVVTTADERDFLEAGRVAYQENAGNLTSTQSTQFLNQIDQIYQQSQNGATAAQTAQAQNQLSVQIYDAAHNINTNGGTPTS
jgi:hypothetical protein